MDLWDMLAWRAGHWPQTPAVEEPVTGLGLTWEELWGSAATLAQELEALGVKPGDRVVGRVQNGVPAVQAIVACVQLGAIWVPLNTRLAEPALADIVEDAQPELIVYDDKNGPIAGVAVTQQLLPMSQPDHGLGKAALNRRPPSHPVACLLYTSGSTGKPKGVMLSHRAVLENTRRVGIELAVQRGEVAVISLPLYHVGGISLFWVFLYFGGQALILPRYDPAVALEAARRFDHVTFLEVPTTMGRLLDAMEDEVPPSLGRVIYSGSPPALGALQRYAGCLGDRLIQFYGLTETAPTLTMLRGSEHLSDRWLQSCGRPLRDIFVVAADDTGKHLPAGTPGEILVHTPAVMEGYWRNPEQTAEVLSSGWFRTGDFGRVDADGYVYILGRQKEMIISGAENIYPKEVEDALSLHPAVKEVAVVGLPDAAWGEVVAAAVVRRSPIAADALEDHCSALLGRFKRPRQWLFLDQMPVLETGKINKAEVRRLLAATASA